jgi:hypothetical protein
MIGGMSSNELSEDRGELSLLEGGRFSGETRLFSAMFSNIQLVDRRRQVKVLQSAFRRRIKPDSVTELLLVSGIYGTGTSQLSGTLEDEVTAAGGVLVTAGKFDQLQLSEPYALCSHCRSNH